MIQSVGGYIFGGYADNSWVSRGAGDVASPGAAFLFALRCHAGLEPIKMPLTNTHNDWAMLGRAHLGPCFGGSGELCLGSNVGKNLLANQDGTGVNIGFYGVYACPLGQDGTTFLTGANWFQAAEVEVYRVETIEEKHTRVFGESQGKERSSDSALFPG